MSASRGQEGGAIVAERAGRRHRRAALRVAHQDRDDLEARLARQPLGQRLADHAIARQRDAERASGHERSGRRSRPDLGRRFAADLGDLYGRPWTAAWSIACGWISLPATRAASAQLISAKRRGSRSTAGSRS